MVSSFFLRGPRPAGGDSVAVRDGVAYARFRAGRDQGRVVIIAESAGLESSRVEIELIKPFGEDALTHSHCRRFG